MDKIGPFQLLETIHLGSQPLFRARGKDGQEVAIKAIPVANLTDETRERFTREAETCRKLDHPNIIRVFETGEADGMLYQAMELLAGADLGKVLSEGRHFDWEARLSIMEQVSSGLQYAHEHQLVHRDIKPANLFLENSGRVKVLDFGMVRVAESELTKVGSSLGTLNYMSPEQIRGERVTAATDVFSAGIVFYQLASGRHPFSSRDRGLAQVVSAIVFEAPPKLSELCPDAPEGLEFILDRALEKDVARRLQNAGDLKHAVSLCRVTLGMASPPAKKDLGATKVMRTPQPQAAPPAPEDDGKTQVLRRPPPASGEPADAGKTRALPRMSPPKPVSPAPAPPPPAPKPLVPPPRPAAAAPQFSYCPSCTFANPAGSAVCQRCQTPFAAPPAAAVVAKTSQMPLYIAVGVAALLAIVLIVVLLMK